MANEIKNITPAPQASSISRGLPLVLAAGIGIVTFFVYLPAIRNNFVNWDDDIYIFKYEEMRSLDIRFLKWVSTAVVSANWHPLTMFSLAVDHALWGFNPLGYHLTSVVLHAMNASLVFILALRLIECGTLSSSIIRHPSSIISAAITALIFGVHPLRVESVVWVSERKDVLCAFFFLLSLLSYIKYVPAKALMSYVLSLIFFILALMSKPMAVSLPMVLLLLDYYPLNRLNKSNAKEIFIEKIPFVILMLLASLTTLWAQQSERAIIPLETLPFIPRIFAGVGSISFYLYKMILPLDLAPLYPYPARSDLLSLGYAASYIIVAAVTFLCIRMSGRNKLPLIIWIYYLITLLPVIGIVKVGGFSAADRYTYLPSIGPFLLTALGMKRITEATFKRHHRLATVAASLLLFIVLGNLTVKQINIWRDSITLWTHEIRLYPNQYSPYYSRGNAYAVNGNYREAIIDFTTVVELNPKHSDAFNNRGNSYAALGIHQEALADYNRVIELNPSDSQAYVNRGNVFFGLGKFDKAITDYNKALELNPYDAYAYNNRGSSYFRLNDYRQAEQDFMKAVRINPEYKDALDNLAAVRSNIKNP